MLTMGNLHHCRNFNDAQWLDRIAARTATMHPVPILLISVILLHNSDGVPLTTTKYPIHSAPEEREISTVTSDSNLPIICLHRNSQLHDLLPTHSRYVLIIVKALYFRFSDQIF